MIFDANEKTDARQETIFYIKEKGFKRVIDIGGTMNPWAREVVTTYFDIQDIVQYLKRYPAMLDDNVMASDMIIGDVNSSLDWGKVLREVEEKGKFDFAICTHTIEDLRDPILTLQMLPLIAKEGFIAAPNRVWEISDGVECATPREHNSWGITRNFRGFFHHRWIFSVKEDVLWLFPKLNFMDTMKCFERFSRKGGTLTNYFHEMSFKWKSTIPYHIINNDYLGPNGEYICKLYEKELMEGL